MRGRGHRIFVIVYYRLVLCGFESDHRFLRTYPPMVDLSTSASSTRRRNAFGTQGNATTGNGLAIARAWVLGQGPRVKTTKTTNTYTSLRAVAEAWKSANPVPRPTDVSVRVSSTAREPPAATGPNIHGATILAKSTDGEERGGLDGDIDVMEGSTGAGPLTDKAVEVVEVSTAAVKNLAKNMVRRS